MGEGHAIRTTQYRQWAKGTQYAIHNYKKCRWNGIATSVSAQCHTWCSVAAGFRSSGWTTPPDRNDDGSRGIRAVRLANHQHSFYIIGDGQEARGPSPLASRLSPLV